MGKWLKICLVTLVVLMTVSLAFGQGQFYTGEPAATAGPDTQVAAPQVAPNGVPTGAPGCDTLPQGYSREETQKAAAMVLSGQTAGKQGPKGQAGHRGGTGKAGSRGPQGLPGIPGQNGRDGQDGRDGRDGTMYLVTDGRITAAGPGTIVAPAGTPAEGGSMSLINGVPNGWLLFAVIVIVLTVLARNATRSWARREERRENNAPGIVAANRMAQQLPAVPQPQGPSAGESMAIHRDSSGIITGIERHQWPVKPDVQPLAPGQALAVIQTNGNVGLHQAGFTPRPEVHLHLHGIPQPGANAVAVATAARREELNRQREAARPAASDNDNAAAEAGRVAGGEQ